MKFAVLASLLHQIPGSLFPLIAALSPNWHARIVRRHGSLIHCMSKCLATLPDDRRLVKLQFWLVGFALSQAILTSKNHKALHGELDENKNENNRR